MVASGRTDFSREILGLALEGKWIGGGWGILSRSLTLAARDELDAAMPSPIVAEWPASSPPALPHAQLGRRAAPRGAVLAWASRPPGCTHHHGSTCQGKEFSEGRGMTCRPSTFPPARCNRLRRTHWAPCLATSTADLRGARRLGAMRMSQLEGEPFRLGRAARPPPSLESGWIRISQFEGSS